MALGDLNIIGDVTQTLKNLLTPPLDVTLDSPASLQSAGNEAFAKINLYLFQVLENPFAKNQRWVTLRNGDQRYPPLALNLYYLLTPYASDQTSAHGVLAHAMQVFYDHAIIKGADLLDSLRLGIEQIAIVLCPLELEDLTRVWNALQTPYRLSVFYEVRIALVDSEQQITPDRVELKTNVYEQR